VKKNSYFAVVAIDSSPILPVTQREENLREKEERCSF
jgi:hypothetical protein